MEGRNGKEEGLSRDAFASKSHRVSHCVVVVWTGSHSLESRSFDKLLSQFILCYYGRPLETGRFRINRNVLAHGPGG